MTQKKQSNDDRDKFKQTVFISILFKRKLNFQKWFIKQKRKYYKALLNKPIMIYINL